MNPLVLASASARRSELLGSFGLSFVVRPSNIDETFIESHSVKDNLLRVVKKKAVSVRSGRNETIISADTIVMLGNNIFGKPSSRADSTFVLQRLSGQTHQVLTGYYILNTETGDERMNICSTDVTFFPLSEADINNYVESGECEGKAGSYAIQGIGSFLVKGIKGCYFNVVGLPISHVIRDLTHLTNTSWWDK